ncbi:MAG: DUF2007 domain-containing protein [Pseudomonadota bacterium]|nr:MAG: DUF2007 domain-containing protein [Pseudomonadota bacterium]
MVRVHSAGSVHEAHFLLHQLDSAGIRAHVFNNFAAGAIGEIPPSEGLPAIWLEDEADRERALAVIEAHEWRAAPGEKIATIYCGECSEAVPENFGICWNCGALLGGEDKAPG